ncbi:MAG: selenocysteine-specific translation elongation factor, partial [bacterium]
MRSITVGTAGHIDHGKSALVRALTGIDPDRLAEEQRRGMTLDLGFAHLQLPSGRRIGIVDVPGHEALIHNMLAGAGGIDLVMLVVAADEGAMPQTREHLDILRFLPLAGGLVALNKIDLGLEPEWVAAVREDLTRLVAGTPLDGARIIPVSARTGAGLPDLLAALDRLTSEVPERPAEGPVRLPVDRSFVMQGFGTVVTGTLWSGSIRPGDLLTVLPTERDVRVRGVQVHGEAVTEARAGSRVAANLSGVEKDEVARGDVLATPGAFRPTDRLDVRLRLLPGAPPLEHAARLHMHLGAGKVIGRVAFVDTDHLEPGREELAQLRLEQPVVAVHGDRFVVRRYSPTETMGGGVVLNALPVRRVRGARAAAALATVDQGGPSALVVEAVASRGPAGMPAGDVAAAAGLESQSAARARSAALADGRLMEIGDRLFASSVAEALRGSIEATLGAYHKQSPWRPGMPREELKSRVST